MTQQSLRANDLACEEASLNPVGFTVMAELLNSAPRPHAPVVRELKKSYPVITQSARGVAQSGSAPHWGCGGRRFKSCRPDHLFLLSKPFQTLRWHSLRELGRGTQNLVISAASWGNFEIVLTNCYPQASR